MNKQLSDLVKKLQSQGIRASVCKKPSSLKKKAKKLPNLG
ncbi:putative peroxiredoxin [Cytobacillus horneckiae]